MGFIECPLSIMLPSTKGRSTSKAMEVQNLVATHAMTVRVEEDCLMRDNDMPYRLEKPTAASAVAK